MTDVDLSSVWSQKAYSDSKAYGANMGHTWGRQDPGGPHVGHMNFAIWVYMSIFAMAVLSLSIINQIIRLHFCEITINFHWDQRVNNWKSQDLLLWVFIICVGFNSFISFSAECYEYHIMLPNLVSGECYESCVPGDWSIVCCVEFFLFKMILLQDPVSLPEQFIINDNVELSSLLGVSKIKHKNVLNFHADFDKNLLIFLYSCTVCSNFLESLYLTLIRMYYV